jgi:flagellar biosynthesis GTPase FlhF
MEFHRNSTPPVDGQTTVVTGSTLSEAFRNVRQEFGPDAVISGSRSRSRRKSSGWGTEQVIEVMVETGDAPARDTEQFTGVLTGEIRYEVERLERMVEDICQTPVLETEEGQTAGNNPLAEYLMENGASQGAVDRMLTRFESETGKPRNDRPGAIAWLMGYFGTGQADLGDWEGNHVFLGEHAEDRLGMALQLAGRLTEIGRRVLVVSVLPDPDRDETRLKNIAAAAGHDAAVVREVGQIQDMESCLADYDLVLVDLPAMTDHRLAEGSPIHGWLASNEKFHRHLLMPMDRDFKDLDDLRDAARSWNCDWVSLTRLEGTRRAAKLLDLMDRIPLPISFMSDKAMGEGILAAATPELLLDRILTAGTPAG